MPGKLWGNSSEAEFSSSGVLLLKASFPPLLPSSTRRGHRKRKIHSSILIPPKNDPLCVMEGADQKRSSNDLKTIVSLVTAKRFPALLQPLACSSLQLRSQQCAEVTSVTYCCSKVPLAARKQTIDSNWGGCLLAITAHFANGKLPRVLLSLADNLQPSSRMKPGSALVQWSRSSSLLTG